MRMSLVPEAVALLRRYARLRFLHRTSLREFSRVRPGVEAVSSAKDGIGSEDECEGSERRVISDTGADGAVNFSFSISTVTFDVVATGEASNMGCSTVVRDS